MHKYINSLLDCYSICCQGGAIIISTFQLGTLGALGNSSSHTGGRSQRGRQDQGVQCLSPVSPHCILKIV